MTDQQSQSPPPLAPEPTPEPPLAPQASPPTRRSFRDRVDDHPIGLLTAVALAAITATLTVVVPLVQMTQDNRVSVVESQMQQDRTDHAATLSALQARLTDQQRQSDQQLADERLRTQARIDELERSLSSIHRTLGTGTEDYDISTLVVDPSDVGSLPDTSVFFPEDRFYGLDPAQSTGWTYEVSSELRLYAEALGLDEAQVRAGMTPGQLDAVTRFPVHLWRYGPDRVVTYIDPATGTATEVHPRTQAWVQRFSQDDFLSLLLQSVPRPLPSASNLAESIRVGFKGDAAGWVLQDQLLSEIGTAGSLRPRIDSLQKRDDLAYARVETVLPDVRVEGKQLDEYYVDREWFIVRTDQDLYLVKLFVADDDHRSPDYGALSSWLDQLRIVGS